MVKQQSEDPRYEALAREIERRGFKVEDVPRLLREMRKELLKGSKKETA